MKKKCYTNLLALVALTAFGLGMTGCSDDATPAEMVTISGVVLAADDLAPVENACVFLLDHPEIISAATTAAGEYSIDVPVGSPFLLTTDDCDAPMSTDGDLYPTINNDTWHTATIEQAYEGWVIHASYTPTAKLTGSLQAYQNFFTGSPTVAAGFFDPVDDINGPHAGFIFFGTFFVDTTDPSYFEDMTGSTVELDEPKCPVGYINLNGAGCDISDPPDGVLDVVCPDAVEAPNILQADGGTETDGSANTLTFCDPSVTATTLTMTVNTPHHGTTSYVKEIPIRPDACTFVTIASVDGEDGSITDVWRALGVVQ